jgi:hypothetical protein
MKKFSEQLKTKSSTVKIQASERRKLRERVVSYMEYHPLATANSTPKVSRKVVVAEPFKALNFSINKKRFLQWSMATAALLVVVTPVMAEQAVPGDALYAIKIQITEPVRSTLAFSPYQKVEWETELLNRRLAEARELASEGKLNGEVEVAMASAVREHTENAKREIEELREDDADEAAIATIAFNTTLEVQSASLRSDTADATSTSGISLLESVINESLAKQANENTQPPVLSLEKLMARVEINTTRVYELLNTVKFSEDTETRKDVTRRLDDIQRTVKEALDLREGGDQASVPLLINSLERSQRLIVFLSELQVGQSSQVEKYVPVMLTPEEKQNYIDQSEKTLAYQSAFIATNLPAVTDADITGRIQFAQTSMAALKEELESKTTFSEIQTTYERAIAIGRDIIELYQTLDIEIKNPAELDTEVEVAPEPATTTPATEEDAEEETSTSTVPLIGGIDRRI